MTITIQVTPKQLKKAKALVSQLLAQGVSLQVVR